MGHIWGWRSSRSWVIATAGLVFVVCCICPIAYLLIELGQRVDALGVALLDARRRGLLVNTALLGVGTAVIATAIGAPLGLFLARGVGSGKAFLRLVLAAPALIPPYVVALAWVYLGNRSEWTFSLTAAMFVLALVFYPLSMLATEVSVRRIDGRLEEAALLAAVPARVLRRITLPLAAPGLLAAALLIFVLAVSEFGVPGLLRVRVYTTEVFTAFGALYDVTQAIALTMPLLALCVGVAGLAATLLGDRLVTTRRSRSPGFLFFDRWNRAGWTVSVLVPVIALALPVMTLAREAGRAESLRAVFAGSGAAVLNSLVLAAIGATLVVTVSVWLGYARGRAGAGIGRAVDVLLIVVFAVPSTVIGVGLIGLWNRPNAFGVVYGTNVMFLLGYLARFVPVATLMLAASARYIPVSHEEAAVVSGAGWARTMSRIVLPQMRAGIAATWVIVFVLAFAELGVSILIAPPGDATLPIRIYTLIANTPSSHVAAFALLQTMVVFVAVASIAATVRTREAT